MLTGIEFFDALEPKPGDLWIVASGSSMGKTTVVRNLAVGLADQPECGQITYWDLEQTHQTWVEKIVRMGCLVPAAFLYRNDLSLCDAYGLLSQLSTVPVEARAVVIDHFDLGVLTSNVVDALKGLKTWLVRSGKFGLISMQLPRSVWGTMKTEGRFDPDTTPEHMLDIADAVFVCGKTPQRYVDRGEADTLRVVACKSPAGIREPHNQHAFTWDHRTGRIS